VKKKGGRKVNPALGTPVAGREKKGEWAPHSPASTVKKEGGGGGGEPFLSSSPAPPEKTPFRRPATTLKEGRGGGGGGKGLSTILFLLLPASWGVLLD